MQLLEDYSTARSDNDTYLSIAALPAGRIAAGHFAGIDVLDLAMAGCEAAPAGTARRPTCAAETILSRAHAVDWCALCLAGISSAQLPNSVLSKRAVNHSERHGDMQQ